MLHTEKQSKECSRLSETIHARKTVVKLKKSRPKLLNPEKYKNTFYNKKHKDIRNESTINGN